MALKLAAFVMQIVYGDYDKSKHKVGYFEYVVTMTTKNKIKFNL